MKADLVIIGGGPAGLAAAVSAYDNGVKDVIILERDTCLGGVLNQCIHNGFGLTRFKENLTGPEYAQKFIDEVEKRDIKVMLNATVIDLDKDKVVTVTSPETGINQIQAKAVILAMGCRERSKGALNIAGERPAGIYSAGTAQRYVNLMGYMPGKNVVILGSGDIGLIMARRMTLEGAKVHAVCEIMPYSSGLKRNIEQCLNDFDIPLYLSHTIVKIEGKNRVTGVVIAQVDQNKKPIKETEKYIPCDTVLFSVGLIPENELSVNAGLNLTAGTKGVSVDQFRQTEIDGVFACGNVLQVHDLVDFVSEESEIAGKGVSIYLEKGKISGREIPVCAGDGVGYALPQRILADEVGKVKLFFRVRNPMKDVKIVLLDGDKVIMEKKKKVVLPGEMETITVTDKIYSSVNSLTLKVVQNG